MQLRDASFADYIQFGQRELFMDTWKKINLFQLKKIEDWHKNDAPNLSETGFLGLIEQLNLQNFLLWHEEDKARDPGATDHEIAQVKRYIDTFNQKRNDLIEQVDQAILTWMNEESIQMPSNTPVNSETPGSIIDRCSIMALKTYHMKEQTLRTDVDQRHIMEASEKLKILRIQREDLLECLVQLMDEIKNGTRSFKIYRQFKMYNDPTLNPKIYNAKND